MNTALARSEFRENELTPLTMALLYLTGDVQICMNMSEIHQFRRYLGPNQGFCGSYCAILFHQAVDRLEAGGADREALWDFHRKLVADMHTQLAGYCLDLYTISTGGKIR